jgi:hypothetical protein
LIDDEFMMDVLKLTGIKREPVGHGFRTWLGIKATEKDKHKGALCVKAIWSRREMSNDIRELKCLLVVSFAHFQAPAWECGLGSFA